MAYDPSGRFSWWRRWLRQARQAACRLLGGSFWADFFEYHHSAKTFPERFPKIKPNLESLEKVLAPQPLVAASMPFLLVGLTATGLPAPVDPRPAPVNENQQPREHHDELSDAKLVAFFTGLAKGQTALVSSEQHATDAGEGKGEDSRAINVFQKASGKLFSDEEPPTPGHGGHASAVPDSNHAAAGGGGTDTHTPEVRAFLGAADPGTSTPPALPDRNSVTAFLDSMQPPEDRRAAAHAAVHNRNTPHGRDKGTAPATAATTSRVNSATTTADGVPLTGMQSDFGQTTLAFVPNVGQTDTSVQFMASHAGFQMFLGAGGAATLEVPLPASTNADPGGNPTTPNLSFDVFRMHLVGADTNARVVTGNQLPAHSNFFTGGDTPLSALDVPNYASITYVNVYPGINLVYHPSSSGKLEYDFVIAAGADPGQIQIAYDGVNSATIDPNTSNLILNTPGGPVIQDAPLAHQGAGTTLTSVGVQQVVTATGALEFNLSGYDPTREVVIDPGISYGSYLGGSGADYAYGVTTNGSGEMWVTGATNSTNFPTTTGAYDSTSGATTNVFVAKLGAAGQLEWSAELGDTSVAAQGNGIAVDAAGNVYVTGTAGAGFPNVNGISGQSFPASGSGGFVAELDAAGDSLTYCTPLGPSTTYLTAIAVDANQEATVTGAAPSGYPTTTGVFATNNTGNMDAVATRVADNGGSLVFSTFVGGTALDAGYGVSVDAGGNTYLTGVTFSAGAFGSTAFPTTVGAYQRTYPGVGSYPANFVVELNATATTEVFGTFLGPVTNPSGSGAVMGIAVDSSGNIYLAGGSNTSGTYPSTTGAFATAASGGYVTKVNAGGASLGYSGVLSSAIFAALTLDRLGNVYLTGSTQGSLPVTSGAFQSSYGGGGDGLLVELNATGTTIVYASYLGGSSSDQGTGIAIDPVNNSLVLAGYTSSTNFPTTSGAAQSSNSGSTDIFLSQVLPVLPLQITALTPDTGRYSTDHITTATTVTLSGTASGNATVTLFREGVGLLGTTTASSGGLWTFAYTGTVLPEGVTAFYGTATVNGLTSDPSTDFLATVDLTPPKVTLSVPAVNSSLGPTVTITAWDLNSLPAGTTVALDISNGTTTTLGYATGTLTNGTTSIKLPTLPTAATYTLDARVYDRAGNLGTSASQTLGIASNSTWTATGSGYIVDPAADARLQVGDATVNQPLDLGLSPWTSQSGSMGLVYHSDWINNKPFAQVTLASVTGTPLPPSITATLIFNHVTQTAVTYTVGGNFSPGDLLVLTQQDSTPIASSGRYPWTMLLQVNYTTTPINLTVNGAQYVAAEDSSPLGSGWTLSGVDQLVQIAADAYGPAGMLRIYGSGGWSFYPGTAPSFSSPGGDNGTLAGSGGWTYTTPDGQVTTFNSGGYQTQWASGDGQETLQYRYNGSNAVTGITAIDGSLTTITYSGGLASTISEPNGRTVSLAYSVGGTDLTQITNPDGGKHSFTYDSTHHLSTERFGLLQNQGGGLTWGSSTSPSTLAVAPQVSRGLTALALGPVWGSITDALGNTWQEQLEPRGRVLQSLAPDGGVTVQSWSQSSGDNAYVTAITDPIGRTTTYARDTKGYVTQLTFPDGNTQQMAYQASYPTGFHALTQFTDENSNSTTYKYDTSNHLTSTTDALGNTTTQTWYSNGLLQSVTDANNNTTSYSYDSNRRLTVTLDALSHRGTLTYDSNGNLSTSTDVLSHTTTYVNDSMGRTTATIDALNYRTTSTYDVSNLPLTYLDQLGHQTSYVYDGYSRGLVVKLTIATGTEANDSTLTGYDAAGRATQTIDGTGTATTSVLDAVGRVINVTNPVFGAATSVYDLAGQVVDSLDELGRLSQQAYNLRGWETQMTDPAGNTVATGFDKVGNATTQTDQLGHTTTTAYDKVNRATLVTAPLGLTTSTAFDPVGNVTGTTDANGNQTTYAYDVLNRQTAVTAAAGTSVAQTSSTGLDAVGNVTTQTDGLGHTTTYALDVLYRVTQVTDAALNTTSRGLDADGNATTTTDGLGKTTTYIYDGQNRLRLTTDPLGDKTLVMLDAVGQTGSVQDGWGDVTTYSYDGWGRLIATIDARGGVTRTQEDPVGNARMVTDSVGNQTTYVWDAMNRQLRSTDANGNATTLAYDVASRLTARTDRLSRVMDYAYDNANRLTTQTWLSTGGTTLNTQTWNYDNNGNVASASDNAGTYTLNYDALNRVKSQTDVLGLMLTISYDKANNRTHVEDSLGGTVTSVYDSINRVTSRQLSGNSMQARLDAAYNADSEMTSLTRYGTTGTTMVVGTTTQSFDAAMRLTAITNYNSGGTTLSYYKDSYDAANRITGETWGSGTTTGTHAWHYDSTSQLIWSDGTTYYYDLNGNRGGFTTGTNNQLTSDGTYTYTYDNEGNLIQKVSTTATCTYGWDNLNRMVSVVQTTTTGVQLRENYLYDIFNNRVEEDKWKASTGTTVTLRHAYDDQGNIWADVTSTNTLLARYVYGDGTNQIWARAIPTGLTNAGVAWYLTDHLGSVRDLMDSTGVIQDHIEYDGYGNPTNTTTSVADSRGYAGGEYDYDTKQEHFGARYYDPATGRWTSQDPMGFGAGDANLYRYVGNDATNAVDPSGLDAAIFGSGIHSGIAVDCWVPVRTWFFPDCDLKPGEKVPLPKPTVVYEHVGILQAEFRAAGYKGGFWETVGITTLGAQGELNYHLIPHWRADGAGKSPGDSVKGLSDSRLVKGTVAEDVRLSDWLAQQGNMSGGLSELLPKIGVKIVTKAKKIKGGLKLWEETQLLPGTHWAAVQPSTGTYASYSVLLGRNCNDFTTSALQAYIGGEWFRLKPPTGAADLIAQWDSEAKSAGGTIGVGRPKISRDLGVPATGWAGYP